MTPMVDTRLAASFASCPSWSSEYWRGTGEKARLEPPNWNTFVG